MLKLNNKFLKKMIILISILSVLLIYLPMFVFATDDTMPALDVESITISKSNATVGEKIKISFRINNISGEVKYVDAYYNKPIVNTLTDKISFEYNIQNGLFESEIEITDTYVNGEYLFNRLMISIGNYGETYYNSENENINNFGQIIDLNAFNFTIYGTTGDNTPPAIVSSSLDISNDRVVIGDTITYKVKVLENTTIKNVNIKLASQIGKYEYTYKTLSMSYNPTSQLYEAKLTVDDSLLAGYWHVNNIYAKDNFNNDYTLYNTQFYSSGTFTANKGYANLAKATFKNFKMYPDAKLEDNGIVVEIPNVTTGDDLKISLLISDDFKIDNVKIYYNQESGNNTMVLQPQFENVKYTLVSSYGGVEYCVFTTDKYSVSEEIGEYGYNSNWIVDRIEVQNMAGHITTLYNKQVYPYSLIDLSSGNFSTYGLKEKNKYTVIFKDFDGTILKTEEVEEGKSATAPSNPVREGYTFVKWNKEFDNVTEDLEVIAEYNKNEELETKTFGDFEYTIDDESTYVTITKYNGSDENVEIPSSIEEIPVTYIGYGTFEFCTNLRSVTIPNSVTNIGARAFADCISLSNITIPSSVTVIDFTAFIGNINLSSINVDSQNTKFLSRDGVLFSYNENKEIGIKCYPEGKKDINYEIQNDVKYINFEAFARNKNLLSVVIPESVIYIEDTAFYGCSNLKKVTIESKASKIDYIGKNIFHTYNPDKQRYELCCDDLAIYGYKDSYSETYANQIGINFVEIVDKKIYTVVFKDYDGKELKKQTVEEGKSATAPANPTRQGYTFTGWDKEFNNITQDLTVTAMYTKNEETNKPTTEETTKIPNMDITPYIFNATYYADMNLDLKNAFGYNKSALKNHYLTWGIKEGRQASPIFNAKYYLDNNGDLKKAFGKNGYEQAYYHFINNGVIEGRQASKYFSVTYYLNKNTDIKNAYSNNYTCAVMHFANYGLNEGRIASKDFNVKDYYNKCSGYVKNKLGKEYLKYYAYAQGAKVIIDSPINITNYMFDVDLYYNLYGDLQKAFGYNVTALKQHYLNCGIKEGRIASYVFDPVYYLQKNTDIKNAYGAKGYESAYKHFINYGINEGRAGSKYFNVKYYLSSNGDLNNTFGRNYSKALEHFVNYGINEGRQASKEFNVVNYKKNNGDLSKAFANNWKQYFRHYMIWGQKENRKCI